MKPERERAVPSLLSCAWRSSGSMCCRIGSRYSATSLSYVCWSLKNLQKWLGVCLDLPQTACWAGV